MRVPILSLLVLAAGCGSSTSMPDMAAGASDMAMKMGAGDMAMQAGSGDMAMQAGSGDMAMSGTLYPLTVNNTYAWCDVIVTINGKATEFSMTGSMSFMAAAGTTVMLSATPNPTYFAVKWTGVTTMSGSMATYVMTTAANQSVTACCPTSAAGAGC
jgi:hypothetical protein